MGPWLSTTSLAQWKLLPSTNSSKPRMVSKNIRSNVAPLSKRKMKKNTKNLSWSAPTGSNSLVNWSSPTCFRPWKCRSRSLKSRCKNTWWTQKKDPFLKKKCKNLKTQSAQESCRYLRQSSAWRVSSCSSNWSSQLKLRCTISCAHREWLPKWSTLLSR